ncbi:drug/metabolite DMT transporter permease [Cystobacter fuscus]|uniref:Drug/metabolite DMT transporter permease n=1 Tax=Cystobacter fuscus TaxID=43 RepID=A0A250J2D2_9BACT|nr:DMT family transporter [Cystobacter fuscus]ATB37733.1 drug/metabolite DMT transporter permease [Cystobacter fuscus]
MDNQQQQQQNRTGVIQLVSAMVLSGTIGIFVTEAHMDAFNVVFFRCLFGAICLTIFCLAKGFFKRSFFTKKTTALIALGGVCIVFNWVFLFKSYGLTSITMGTILYHTQPFYVVLLGVILFKERISANKILWICLAFVGMVFVTNLQASDLKSTYIEGILYSLAAAVLYGIATIVAKRLKGIPPHLIALCQITLGMFLLYPFTTLQNVPTVGTHWYYLAGLGLIHTCIMYILMYSSYQKLDTTKIAVLSFIYPAVALIIDFAVYGTRLAPFQGLGVVLIFLSSIAVNRNWNFAFIGPKKEALS